jgi:hypothetical protein
VLLLGARAAHGFEVRESWPIDIGGRLQSEVRVDRGSAPLSWDFTSRAPTDRTRLMLDLSAGTERYGMLYIKGDGTWHFSEGSAENVPFSFNQGDYLWGRSGETWDFAGRAFADERRYFTGEHGGVVLFDDRVDQYEDFYGARFDGDVRAFRWSLLGSGLDDGTSGTRGIGYGRAGWEGNHVQVSASYLYDVPARDSLGHHQIAKAEVAGFYKRATAVVSYESSRIDGVTNDLSGWGDWNGSNYTEAMPANSATFAEFRLAGMPAPSWGRVDFIARYRAVGQAFYNDLGRDRPGAVTSRAGLYLEHRKQAINGRLVYRRDRVEVPGGQDREWMEGSVRTLFTNNVDAFVRGAFGRRRDAVEDDRNQGFLHGGFRRNLRKFTGGLYAMGLRGAGGNLSLRYGAEMRVNISASSAFYGRLIQNQAAASNDAIYMRFEFRPVLHIFAVFSYGRDWIGDDPYLLEDRDITGSGSADNVYTISVRGDF